MGNVVGPTWGSEVAGIIMQGAERESREEMQQQAIIAQAQQTAFQSVVKSIGDLAASGKMPHADAVEALMKAAMPMLTSASGGGWSEQEVKALVESSIPPKAVVDAAVVDDKIAMSKVELESAQVGLQSARHQESMLGATEERWAEKLGLEMDIMGADRDIKKEQPAAIRASTDATKAGAEGTRAKTDLLEQEEAANLAEGRRAVMDAQVRRMDAESQMIGAEMAATGSDKLGPEGMKNLNERARVLLSMVDKDDERGYTEAVQAVMLMYEEAGVPFPWTVRWAVDHPGWFAKTWAAISGNPYPIPDVYLEEKVIATPILGKPDIRTDEQKAADARKEAEEADAAAAAAAITGVPNPEDLG